MGSRHAGELARQSGDQEIHLGGAPCLPQMPVMSPSSATSVAATSARPRCACSASAASMWAQDDPAEPSPPRRPPCNLPARCNALRVRTTIRRASAGALGSRPAGYNDGHGAAGSRRVAGAPAATRAPPPAARAPDRGSPHGLVWNPHRRQFTRSVQFGQVNRVTSAGFDPIAGQRRGDHDAFVPCSMTRLLCMRRDAGPSSATLVNLHIVRRVAPISGQHLV
jgi:hypothetical protein